MKYSEKYRQDVNKIKLITDISKRRAAVIKVAAAYNISEATIYRHLDKEVPGLRKPRTDKGKEKVRVPKKAVDMVSEMVKSGSSIKDAVESATGRKDTRTRQKISKQVAKQKETDGYKPTFFGKEYKEFFEKFFNFELIAPDAGVELKCEHEGKPFKFVVAKEYLADINVIIANAYNSTSDKHKLAVDRAQLQKIRLQNLIDYMITLAQNQCDMKGLEALTRMYKRFEADYGNVTPEFETVEKICKALKPDISFDDIFALIEKYS